MSEDVLGQVRWHPRYRPDWDEDPWQYVRSGVLPSGRTRRLGSLVAPPGVHLHIGVQHFDPLTWGGRGEASCKFFVSFKVGRRTAGLWTHASMSGAFQRVEALRAVLEPLLEGEDHAAPRV